jgi:hypothetical protein
MKRFANILCTGAVLLMVAAAGPLTAALDTAIALLEAQMGGRVAESWPAFAMRHGG